MNLFVQVVLLFSFLCIVLVGMIDQSNEIIVLRAELPKMEKEMKGLQEEIVKVKYELLQMENPVRLMELLKKPEFGHLIFPREDEVVVVE